jgi:hypothetical protein
MDAKFCSILATEEGEPIEGTAPEKDSAIFLPAQKTVWHRVSPKVRLGEISKNTELGQTIASFQRPLIIFYAPDKRSGDHIFVSDSSGIKCFSSSGLKIEKQVNYIYAICTDGVKDACCAKFGIPVAQAFAEECKDDQYSLSFETSHIGGCRFAATAVCFPSGNSYGRIFPETAGEIKKSEEKALIVSQFFRGNVFVSEIHCWIMRHCMDKFGYVPTEKQTEVEEGENCIHITVTPNQRPKFKFDLVQNNVEFELFSGCSNLDSGRSITRSIYDFALSHA